MADNPPQLKAVLFDMDGTLYDSMGLHASAWKRMCDMEGIPAVRDEFFRYEGRTGASTINLLMQRTYGRPATAEEVERLYGLKSRFFNEMPKAPAFDGAREILDYLRLHGIKRILVTGSGQASLIDRLERDFPGAFAPDMMVTSRSVVHGKPHPEPYLRGLELAGVDAREAVVFENAPLGITSAKSAGIFTVAFASGPLPEEELIAAGADMVIHSLCELNPKCLFSVINSRNVSPAKD